MGKLRSVDDILAELRAQSYTPGSTDPVATALSNVFGGVPVRQPAATADDLGSRLAQGVDLGAPSPPSGLDRLSSLPSAGSSSTVPQAPAGLSGSGLLASFTDPPPEPSKLSRTPLVDGPADAGAVAAPTGLLAQPTAPTGLLGGTPAPAAGGGFLSRLGHSISSYFGDVDPTTGLTGGDHLRMLGASLRDDPRYRIALNDEFKDRAATLLKRQQLLQDNAAVSAIFGGAGGDGVGGGAPPAQAGAAASAALNPAAASATGGVTTADGSHMNAPDPSATTPGAPLVGLSDRQRKGLAEIALRSGHADQAASIMSGDVTSDANGYLLDHKTGRVLGRVPIHSYVNGFNVDANAPDAPSFIPQLPNGVGPDGAGGVGNLRGYVPAMAAQAGATTGATEGAKAALDLVAVPDGRGGTKMMPRSVAAMMLGGGGGAAGGGAGGAGVGGPSRIAGGIGTDGGGLSPAASAALSQLLGGGGRRGAPAPAGGGMGGGFGTTMSAADTELATGRAKTQVERDAGLPKAFSGLRQQASATDFVLNTIDRLLPKINGWTAGLGSNLAGIKGTAAHDVQADIDTIRANVGFDQLKAMRDSSPTGGALGQVSEQENKLLQSVLGSLDAGQSPGQMSANLTRLATQLRAAKAAREDAFAATYGSAGGGSAPARGGYSQADMRSAALAELRRRGAR